MVNRQHPSQGNPGARITAEETTARLTPAVQAVLAELHPDPFTQAALWRVFLEAPIWLSESAYLSLFGADRGTDT